MEREELELLIEQSMCYEERVCPRCGGELNEVQERNAISRYANAYVCPECGADEALRDVVNAVMSFDKWFIVKNQ